MRKVKHGHASQTDKTYKAWVNMRARCLKRTNPNFKNYGGRGIKVCARWLVFTNFLADMGVCPNGYSLERKDYNGNYEPNNCLWIHKNKQQNNRRTSRFIEFRGKTQTLADWSKELHLSPRTLWGRMNKGWSVERAFTTPARKRRDLSGAADNPKTENG